MNTTIRTLLVASTLSAVALAVPSQAEAACGSSAATVAADVWEEFHDEALMLGCAVGAVLANADFDDCYGSVSFYSDIFTNMISWWNDMANNSWATIGPRQLQWTGVMNGTLQLGGGRVFCSAAPSDKETVDITIEKLDGRAETEVEICKMRKDGTSVTTHTFTFANGTDNIGAVKTRTVTSAKDDVICVHLDNKSATNSFQYSLDADKY
ncbi:hypothetical protein [Nannocystis radixulma]|uniref:Uncharacterized protein n=1 Tax=Nannocystis radixulma TaxID=2995305 RepID=A0ABT5BKE9_9BACT|nr:hypothetical protein [Nannocystis radixulma]MDC0673416.1 hypothetical protein [Nannocystis radixulma]